jgi:hypothetical protein
VCSQAESNFTHRTFAIFITGSIKFSAAVDIDYTLHDAVAQVGLLVKAFGVQESSGQGSLHRGCAVQVPSWNLHML